MQAAKQMIGIAPDEGVGEGATRKAGARLLIGGLWGGGRLERGLARQGARCTKRCLASILFQPHPNRAQNPAPPPPAGEAAESTKQAQKATDTAASAQQAAADTAASAKEGAMGAAQSAREGAAGAAERACQVAAEQASACLCSVCVVAGGSPDAWGAAHLSLTCSARPPRPRTSPQNAPPARNSPQLTTGVPRKPHENRPIAPVIVIGVGVQLNCRTLLFTAAPPAPPNCVQADRAKQAARPYVEGAQEVAGDTAAAAKGTGQVGAEGCRLGMHEGTFSEGAESGACACPAALQQGNGPGTRAGHQLPLSRRSSRLFLSQANLAPPLPLPSQPGRPQPSWGAPPPAG